VVDPEALLIDDVASGPLYVTSYVMILSGVHGITEAELVRWTFEDLCGEDFSHHWYKTGARGLRVSYSALSKNNKSVRT
jgi:hypothetical protein